MYSPYGLGGDWPKDVVDRVDAEATGLAALQEQCGGEHEVDPGQGEEGNSRPPASAM